MEDEWDAKILCVIEEDELALLTMMGKHIDYENDQIIDLEYSKHMINNQSSAIEAVWPLEKEVLLDFSNIEEILPQKIGEKNVHIWLIVDVFKYPRDNNVGEQDVTPMK